MLYNPSPNYDDIVFFNREQMRIVGRISIIDILINMYSEQSRCSHFKSVCYFALSLLKRRNMFLGVQCTETCDSVVLPTFSNRIDVIPMGLQTPEW